VEAPLFDLRQTLTCGQVFHWRPRGDGWIGVVGREPVRIEQCGPKLKINREAEEVARHYFALDHDLEEIYRTFPTDPAMTTALASCRGLRIVRQPPWECLATFITSAMKQVPHIAKISHTLRERFGKCINFESDRLFAYPLPEQIAALTEADLRACALGFRAKNLLGAARMIASGEVSLDAVAAMSDADARAELCRLPGVGEKVANCALLFGFGRLRAFPIDVWIDRVLRKLYFAQRRKVTARRLREFSEKHFGPYAGYAQQYLFHHARMTWRDQQAA
jgi:N-glycosylase/DNA lyase